VEFEQWGSKFGGWGSFGFWARTPHLTTAFYSSCDLEKNGFCLGGIGPHLGEIWGFEIWHFLAFWRILAYFCSELCRQIFDFLTAFDRHTCRLTMLKISGKLNSTISSNVRLKLATSPSRQYFRVARGLNNGVMVTPPGGSSITVRDRPPNVLGVE